MSCVCHVLAALLYKSKPFWSRGSQGSWEPSSGLHRAFCVGGGSALWFKVSPRLAPVAQTNQRWIRRSELCCGGTFASQIILNTSCYSNASTALVAVMREDIPVAWTPNASTFFRKVPTKCFGGFSPAFFNFYFLFFSRSSGLNSLNMGCPVWAAVSTETSTYYERLISGLLTRR